MKLNILTTLAIGGVIHALIGAGVFFSPEEPYKIQIFVATTIKGLLVALLIGFSLRASQGMGTGAMYGLLYGFAFGLVVFLAKGASVGTTPYLIGGSVIQGIISGVLIVVLAFRR
jgi:hypothetical protein